MTSSRSGASIAATEPVDERAEDTPAASASRRVRSSPTDTNRGGRYRSATRCGPSLQPERPGIRRRPVRRAAPDRRRSAPASPGRRSARSPGRRARRARRRDVAIPREQPGGPCIRSRGNPVLGQEPGHVAIVRRAKADRSGRPVGDRTRLAGHACLGERFASSTIDQDRIRRLSRGARVDLIERGVSPGAPSSSPSP